MEMRSDPDLDSAGVFEERYKAFLETIGQLRPNLHRYCARMTGSVLDGEDVVQEALFEAYRKLDKFDDRLPLKPWLYRIVHNRAIDFLRKQKVRNEAETALGEPAFTPPLNPSLLNLAPAVERLVINLPPMERACVLLKDVFDYSLQETAEVVGSTVGRSEIKLSTKDERSSLHATRYAGRHGPDPQLVVSPALCGALQPAGLECRARTHPCRRTLARHRHFCRPYGGQVLYQIQLISSSMAACNRRTRSGASCVYVRGLDTGSSPFRSGSL